MDFFSDGKKWPIFSVSGRRKKRSKAVGYQGVKKRKKDISRR